MTARSFHRAAIALLAAAAIGSGARAAIDRTESGSPPLRWDFDRYQSDFQPDQNPATLAIRFHLGTTVSVRGVQSNEWNAVRAAFGQWQSVPGTKIRFEEGAPRTAPTTVSALDGHNDVAWLSQGTYGDASLGERIAFGSGTIALTVLGLDADFSGNTTGIIVESDILVNRDLDYVTDINGQSANNPFLESAVLHEIGHLLGMNHSPVGSATMWWYQGGGVGPAAGLSSDEVSWARSAYGTSASASSTGTIRGTVKVGCVPVLGALVYAERGGAVEAGTATASDGTYAMKGLTPGTYRLWVQPLDPNAGGDAYLIRGFDLDVSGARVLSNGTTAFLGMSDGDFAVGAGATVTRNLAPSAGNPAFRITGIRTGFARGDRGNADQPLGLAAGQTNAWVGVYVPSVLAADTVLRITGDGLAVGPTEVVRPSLRDLTLVQAPVTVLAGATPGMRTIEVTSGGFTARAPGFLDVAGPTQDFNFDGLDDAFQRRYFRPFTQPAAAPDADPDGDGFVNRREAARGSDPTDPKSYGYRVVSVRLTASGTTVRWESAAGRKYQVWSREDIGSGTWAKVGGVVTANGEAAELVDPRPATQIRLYRVQDPP